MEQLKIDFALDVSQWLILAATADTASIEQKKKALLLIDTINRLLDENAIGLADIAIQFSDGKVLFVDSSVHVTDPQLRSKNATVISSLLNHANHELVAYLNAVLTELIELTLDSISYGCFALEFTKQQLDEIKSESA